MRNTTFSPLLIVVGFVLVLGAGRVFAQGAVGGTLRDADGSIPATSAIRILVVDRADPSNLLRYPGGIDYSAASGTYVVPFERFPSPITAGAVLQVSVDNDVAGSFGSLEFEVVNAEAGHVGNIVMRILPPADLRLRNVSTVATALRGALGIPVEVNVENLGGRPGSLGDAALTFHLGLANETAHYVVYPAAGNPTELAAGATASLTFAVDVLPAAALGQVTVNARLDGDPDGADSPVTFLLDAPAEIRLLEVRAPPTVIQGQRGILLTVTVANSGGRAASLQDPGPVFLRGAEDRAADYAVDPAVSNVKSLAPGQAATLQYTVDVSPEATPGPVTLDMHAGADPDGADVPATWVVSAAAILSAAPLAAPAGVSPGQTGLSVRYRIQNVGSLSSPLSGLGLTFVGGGMDRASDYIVSAANTFPSTVAANGSAEVSFAVGVSPAARPGAVTVGLRFDQSAGATLATTSWTVSWANAGPVANAGFDRTYVASAHDLDLRLRLTGHDSVDPDRPTTSPALPTLAFFWRVASAVTPSGTPIPGAKPFLGGTASALAGTGGEQFVDPEVRLLAPGTYRFGLLVQETGPSDPGNMGAASEESFVTIAIRAPAANGNRPPACEASINRGILWTGQQSIVLTATGEPQLVRFQARAPGDRAVDAETPAAAMAFSWSRQDSEAFGPQPPAALTTVSEYAFLTVTAPGAYEFVVAAVDDGRMAPASIPDAANRLTGLPSRRLRVLVRPPSNTFPVLDPVTATTEAGRPVSFSSPFTIPATAGIGPGAGPAVMLTARALDGETPAAALTFQWTQVQEGSPASPVTLEDLGGGRARFVPPASGLYRFRVEASDGQLAARASVVVPVDDLRAGGRIGVSPRINGLDGTADPMQLAGQGGLSFSRIVLDASESLDRRSLHGQTAHPVTFFWSQTSGPALLEFDATASKLEAMLPAGLSGQFGFALVADNGLDAVRQEVLVAVAAAGTDAGSFYTGGGCTASGPGRAAVNGDGALAVLLLAAWSWRRRRRKRGNSARGSNPGNGFSANSTSAPGWSET